MGYHDHDSLSMPEYAASTATAVLIFIVRVIGIGLLGAGIILAVTVMMEAWALYRYPDRIEAFAHAVERGSNIDQALSPPEAPAAPSASDETSDSASDSADEATSATDSADEAPLSNSPPSPAFARIDVRLSYFFAWFIVFILIMLLARIALAAITTGGRLALYDTEVKRLARALLEERRKLMS